MFRKNSSLLGVRESRRLRRSAHRTAAGGRTVHRGTGDSGQAGIRGELRRLSRLRPDGCAATCRRRLHRRMAHAQHARSVHPAFATSMPADNPGGLSENNYANIVAYILQSNGVRRRHDAAHANDGREDRRSGSRSRRTCHAPARGAAPPAAAAQAPAGRGAGAQGAAAGGGRGRGQEPAPHWSHGQRRGEELRARHRRDAAQSRPGRLADAAPRSVRIELQPADADHARQRAGSAAGVGLRRWTRAARISPRRSRTTGRSSSTTPAASSRRSTARPAI